MDGPGASSRSTSIGSATAMPLMSSDVLRRGLTRIVARSASRLRTTYMRGDQERDRLDDRHVAGAHRVDEEQADALVVEDGLDHDDASREVREVECGDLEGRRQRVRHRMPPEDAALRQALEPCHLDEVALEDLDRRRAHDPRGVRRRPRSRA